MLIDCSIIPAIIFLCDFNNKKEEILEQTDFFNKFPVPSSDTNTYKTPFSYLHIHYQKLFITNNVGAYNLIKHNHQNKI